MFLFYFVVVISKKECSQIVLLGKDSHTFSFFPMTAGTNKVFNVKKLSLANFI